MISSYVLPIATILLIAGEIGVTYFLWRLVVKNFGKYWRYHAYDVVILTWVIGLGFGFLVGILSEKGLLAFSSPFFPVDYQFLIYMPLILVGLIRLQMARLGKVEKGASAGLLTLGVIMAIILTAFELILSITLGDTAPPNTYAVYTLFRLVWQSVLIIVFTRLYQIKSRWANLTLLGFLYWLGLTVLKYIYLVPGFGAFALESFLHFAILIFALFLAKRIELSASRV